MSYTGAIHTVTVGDLTRDLRLFRVAPGVTIDIFNMLGDTEVVEHAADALAAYVPASTQTFVVPEVKAVPLGHALSQRTGLPYVVVRKVRKPYMGDCLETEVISITTGAPQRLYLDGKDLPLVQGCNVVLLDDVISTGSTLRGMKQLMAGANATVVGEMAVFTEGGAGDWPTVFSLGHLPIFPD
ncbi:MAG: phosphoribosyltransferase family protein [Caldilineaceae bacterium]